MMPSAASPSVQPRGPLHGKAEAATVAAKAFARIAEAWRLRNEEAGRLLDVSGRTWNRMKTGDWSGRLSQDQLLRASGVIGLYKALHLYFGDALADDWVRLPNAGPAFANRRPLDAMIEGGLPAILSTRDYVDALRGGV
ncbi:antitoxin Xre-like helix-turn-helix domain-containing protein [Aquibium sp. ELW1220]|uniref:antitoxin Xre-like helix-turn-helix domain-containing protein n=1 Tax=Aquibium sp. ELW1220 TaxID=2976766 RepID=UPI0025AF1B53|nr:antitoxin Xre-like helix-turn-helix domain-containing protein [Aquibium sp. ELW1220]MDN2579350.1 MbcA/ParS/Xre antitoxin family protein [Aquibium sp. ELW1220]